MTDAPIVFVVGLQKSGTTLLLRLLTSTPVFRNPVKFEGKELWGDDPPFSPTAYPAGTLYQQHNGDTGHELGAEDASDEIAEHLHDGLRRAASRGRALVLKNPYNTGRVPWIREMFPDAHIVAVVRRPLPNVFSLLKKHTPNRHLKRGAEEGWWGLKPAGWRDLVQDDKLLQCAEQWDRVNGKLWSERDQINSFVAYHDLCAQPGRVIADIARATIGTPPDMEFPPLHPQDDEYLTGGPLESANRVYSRTKSLELEHDNRAEEMLPPLTEEQQAAVERICGNTASALGIGV